MLQREGEEEPCQQLSKVRDRELFYVLRSSAPLKRVLYRSILGFGVL